jgi:hypothetical protein
MKNLTNFTIYLLVVLCLTTANAQEPTAAPATQIPVVGTSSAPTEATVTAVTPAPVEVKKEEEKKKHWYEVLSLRGYLQMRYNRLFETNGKLKCDQCDKSWGDKNGMFIRRARVIISGNVSDRVYLYFQPDFASGVSGTTNNNFAQLRDAYFDVALDEKKRIQIPHRTK